MSNKKPMTPEEVDIADRAYSLDLYTRDALANHECTLRELKRRYFNKVTANQNIHAVHMIGDMWERHVSSNPGIFLDPKFFDLSYKVGNLIAELYQAIGQKL